MQQVGRYRIVKEIGKGAMGVVYQAEDPAIGRMVAIKSIRLGDLTTETERERLRDRLMREAKAAGMLSHPGIITIYDVSQQDQTAYVFMELVNGPTLEKLLRHGPLPDQQAILALLAQTAAALDYAHGKGIVHRDIKPANIMIDESGAAKIADFGVAKILSQEATASGHLMGTPSYMSPEQVQGQAVTGASDQFSLAVVAYEILTGEKPFSAENVPALLLKIAHGQFAAPHDLNPELSLETTKAFQRALAKSPAQRYKSCTAFVAELSQACGLADWMGSRRAPPSESETPGVDSTVGATMAEKPAPVVSIPTIAIPIIDEHATGRHALYIEKEPKPWRRFLLFLLGLGLVIVASVAYLSRPQVAEVMPRYSPPVPSIPELAAVPAPASVPVAAPAPTPVSEPQPREVQPSEPQPNNALFQLTTNPAGADAVFNGDPNHRCTSPCTSDLPLGNHTVAIHLSGHRDTTRSFNLPDEPGLIVNLEAIRGTLRIITSPPGLSIAIDGQDQRQKTPASFSLPPGTHRLTIIRGTERQEFTAEVRDSAITTKTVEWAQ